MVDTLAYTLAVVLAILLLPTGPASAAGPFREPLYLRASQGMGSCVQASEIVQSCATARGRTINVVATVSDSHVQYAGRAVSDHYYAVLCVFRSQAARLKWQSDVAVIDNEAAHLDNVVGADRWVFYSNAPKVSQAILDRLTRP